jgi:DNA-binding response OmpR family regulator
MRILLVEDHQRLAQSIVGGLAGFGFGVDLFMTAEEGLAISVTPIKLAFGVLGLLAIATK